MARPVYCVIVIDQFPPPPLPSERDLLPSRALNLHVGWGVGRSLTLPSLQFFAARDRTQFFYFFYRFMAFSTNAVYRTQFFIYFFYLSAVLHLVCFLDRSHLNKVLFCILVE